VLIEEKGVVMPTFRDLRSAAGLTVWDTCQLLGIDLTKIETYETGQVVPRPRELQVLKGLAKTRRKSSPIGVLLSLRSIVLL